MRLRGAHAPEHRSSPAAIDASRAARFAVKWLLVCDPTLPIEEYGDLLPGSPSSDERAGCPSHFRAVYLEASLEQMRPLAGGDERVCRLRPIWEPMPLSPAEALVLRRRMEALGDTEGKP